MKRFSVFLAILLVVIAGLIVINSTTGLFSLNTNDEIIIGYATPLTGDAASWGIPPKEGIELAYKQVNSKNVKLFFEDSKCDPKEAVISATKLIQIDKVDVIIGEICSGATLSIAPLVEENKVVLISPASTNPTITNAGDYIFRVVPSDALRGQAFAKFVYDEKKRNVAILYINNASGEGGMKSFKETFIQLGGKITSVDTYNEKDTDIRLQLYKIKNLNIDTLVILSFVKDSIMVIEQSHEIGLNSPLYFQTEAIEDPSVMSLSKDLLENITYILPAESNTKETENFKQIFSSMFNKDAGVFAAEGYDAFNLIVKSSQNCNTNYSECIKQNLYKTKNYDGASGIIKFNKYGDVYKPQNIKRIKNGIAETIFTG